MRRYTHSIGARFLDLGQGNNDMNKILTRFIAAIGAATILSISGGTALAGGFLDVAFEDAVFSNPLVLDNPYWPLRPDNQPRTFTYIGETEDECAIDQISVNDGDYGATYKLTTKDKDSPYKKFIAVQVVDTEWVFEDTEVCDMSLLPDDSAIKEKTLDWYAQDDQGNIWYLGEDSENFEDECGPYPGFGDPDCLEGSWEAGINGAPDDEEEVFGEAGIVVPSNEPIAGEPLTSGAYWRQEVAYEAEDMAKVLKLDDSLSVEDGVYPGEYEHCRTVKEWTALEPGESVEHKTYCVGGNGLVLIEGLGGGRTEIEVLIHVTP